MGPAQFLIQFGLSLAVTVGPGLMLWNFTTLRRPRVPLRWQLVILVGFAYWLASAPWNSTAFACPDC